VTWVLWDRCLRSDYKTDDMIRDGEKWCHGLVEIHGADDQVVTVERFRKHPVKGSTVYVRIGDADVTGGRNEMTQSTIERLLGMNFTTYVNVLAFGARQDVKSFFTAPDSERKAILEKLLSLELYAKARDVAKAEQTALAAKFAQYETDLTGVLQQIASLNEQLAAVQESAAILGDDPEVTVAMAKAKVTTLISLIASLKAEAVEHQAELAQERSNFAAFTAEYRQAVADAKVTTRALSAKRDPFVQKKAAAQAAVNSAQSAYTAAQAPLPTDQGGKPCPTCGQAIPHKHTPEQKAAMLKARTDKIDAAKKTLDDAKKALDAAVAALGIVDVEIATHAKEVDELDAMAPQEPRDFAELTFIINAVNERRHAAEVELGAAQEHRNTMVEHYDTITGQRETITAAREKMEVQADELSTLTNKAKEEAADAKFWYDAFGDSGVKSFLIEAVLPEVNKFATGYAQTLLGPGSYVRMNATKKLKTSESTREQLSIEAYVPGCARKYGGASKGQRLRLDLSLLFAFRKVAAQRASKAVAQLFADEIFDGMDRSGCENVIELLQEIATECSVILISHDPRIKRNANHVITVVHEGGVSRVA
jgi:DNA repair exonuclease SbcCD ATPase subunit